MARLATPHDKFGSTASPWTFADLPGAGGVYATMRDMMRFAKAQLNPPSGKLGEAIELAWIQQRDADASGAAMGLGWMIAGDKQTRWHNGQTGGYHAALLINREFNCAAVILCNTAVDEVDDLAIQMVQKAAGRPDKTERNKSADAPKLSPFTAVRFEDDQVIVTYDGAFYEWLELDGIKVEKIVASSKKQFGSQWQKRIGEDLVELLWGMDHRPGNTVNLRLQDLQSKQDVVIDKAPMTRENRSAISSERPTANQAAPVAQGEVVAIDANLRSRLVGRYQLAPEFIFDVSDRDGRLMVGATNQTSLEVTPDSPTRWSCAQLGAAIEFDLPKTGPANSLVLHQGGAQQTAKRIENDLAIDAKLRSRLVGRYQILPNFIFDVQDRDGHLMVGITNQPTLEVHPDSPTRWHYREVDATLEFQLPKAGRARSLILHQDGAAQKARRIK